MQWMEIAYGQLGVAEIKGQQHAPEILDYFREVGRPDVTNDETAWCAAFYGACLARAGIDISSVPLEQRLLARAWIGFGTTLAPTDLRVGAGCVLKRPAGGPHAGHIGHVTGWTETRVRLISGNQADKVTESWFPRADIIGLFWPAPPATAAELAAQGSRIAAASRRQQGDVAKTGATQISTPLAPAAPDVPPKPSLDALAQKASGLKSVFETMEAFAGFAAAKWPYLAAGLAVYWIGRMAWDAWIIREARTEDHNKGKTA